MRKVSRPMATIVAALMNLLLLIGTPTTTTTSVVAQLAYSPPNTYGIANSYASGFVNTAPGTSWTFMSSLSSPSISPPHFVIFTPINATAKAIQIVKVDATATSSSSSSNEEENPLYKEPVRRGVIPVAACSRGAIIALNTTHVFCDTGLSGLVMIVLAKDAQASQIFTIFAPTTDANDGPRTAYSFVPMHAANGTPQDRYLSVVLHVFRANGIIDRDAPETFTLQALDLWSFASGSFLRNASYAFSSSRTCAVVFNYEETTFDIFKLTSPERHVSFAFERVACDGLSDSASTGATFHFKPDAPGSSKTTTGNKMWLPDGQTEPGVMNYINYAEYSFQAQIRHKGAHGAEIIVLFSAWFSKATSSHVIGKNPNRQNVYNFYYYNAQHIELMRFTMSSPLDKPSVSVLRHDTTMYGVYSKLKAPYFGVPNKYGYCHLRLLCGDHFAAAYCFKIPHQYSDRGGYDPLDPSINKELAMFDLENNLLVFAHDQEKPKTPSLPKFGAESGFGAPLVDTIGSALLPTDDVPQTANEVCLALLPAGQMKLLVTFPFLPSDINPTTGTKRSAIPSGSLKPHLGNMASLRAFLTPGSQQRMVAVALTTSSTSGGKTVTETQVSVYSTAFGWSSAIDTMGTNITTTAATPDLPALSFFHAALTSSGYQLLMCNGTHLFASDGNGLSSTAPNMVTTGSVSATGDDITGFEPIVNVVVEGVWGSTSPDRALVTIFPNQKLLEVRKLDAKATAILTNNTNEVLSTTNAETTLKPFDGVTSAVSLGESGVLAVVAGKKLLGLKLKAAGEEGVSVSVIWQQFLPSAGGVLKASATYLFYILKATPTSPTIENQDGKTTVFAITYNILRGPSCSSSDVCPSVALMAQVKSDCASVTPNEAEPKHMAGPFVVDEDHASSDATTMLIEKGFTSLLFVPMGNATVLIDGAFKPSANGGNAQDNGGAFCLSNIYTHAIHNNLKVHLLQFPTGTLVDLSAAGVDTSTFLGSKKGIGDASGKMLLLEQPFVSSTRDVLKPSSTAKHVVKTVFNVGRVPLMKSTVRVQCKTTSETTAALGLTSPLSTNVASGKFSLSLPTTYSVNAVEFSCLATQNLTFPVALEVTPAAPQTTAAPPPETTIAQQETTAPPTPSGDVLTNEPTSLPPVSTDSPNIETPRPPPPPPSTPQPIAKPLPPASGEDPNAPTPASTVGDNATPFPTATAPSSPDATPLPSAKNGEQLVITSSPDHSRPVQLVRKRITADGASVNVPANSKKVYSIFIRLPYPGLGQLLVPLYPIGLEVAASGTVVTSSRRWRLLQTPTVDTSVSGGEENVYEWPSTLQIDNLRGTASMTNVSLGMANALLRNLVLDVAKEAEQRGVIEHLNFEVTVWSTDLVSATNAAVPIEYVNTPPLKSMKKNAGPEVAPNHQTTVSVPRGKAFRVDLQSPFAHPLGLSMTVTAVLTNGFPMPSCLRVSLKTKRSQAIAATTENEEQLAVVYQDLALRGQCNDETTYNLRLDGSDGYRYTSTTLAVKIAYMLPKAVNKMSAVAVKLGSPFTVAVPFDRLFVSSSDLTMEVTLHNKHPLPVTMRVEGSLIFGTLYEEGKVKLLLKAVDVFDNAATTEATLTVADAPPRQVGSFPIPDAPSISSSTSPKQAMMGRQRTKAPQSNIPVNTEVSFSLKFKSIVFDDADDDSLAVDTIGASDTTPLLQQADTNAAPMNDDSPQSSAMQPVPSWLMFTSNPNAVTISGKAPTELMGKVLTLFVAASDGYKTSSPPTPVQMTFMPNRPPFVKSPVTNATFTTEEDVVVSLASETIFGDLDVGDKVVVSNVMVDGELVGPTTYFRFDVTASILYADPRGNPSSKHRVEVKAADASGATATTSFSVTIHESWYAFIERNWIFFTAVGSLALSIIGLYWYWAAAFNTLKGKRVVVQNPLRTATSHRLPKTAVSVQAYVTLDRKKRSCVLHILALLYQPVSHYWRQEMLLVPLLTGDPLPPWLEVDGNSLCFVGGAATPPDDVELVTIRAVDHSGIILEEFNCEFHECYNYYHKYLKEEGLDDDDRDGEDENDEAEVDDEEEEEVQLQTKKKVRKRRGDTAAANVLEVPLISNPIAK